MITPSVDLDQAKVGKVYQLQVEISFIAKEGADSSVEDTLDLEGSETNLKSLEFDMEDYMVPRVTCSEVDTDWVASLPPFLDLQENEDDVEVTLISVSVPDLLQFNEKDRTVLFARKNRNKVIRGQTCPEPNVQMTFKLQSKTLRFSI